MKLLRNRLEETRQRLGLHWEILERDYVLSWLLPGVSCVEVLRDTLVFKGGTALKKCFFGDYCLSEDLDFTGIGDVSNGEEMEWAVQEVYVAAMSLLNQYTACNVRFAQEEIYFAECGLPAKNPLNHICKSVRLDRLQETEKSSKKPEMGVSLLSDYLAGLNTLAHW